MSVPGQVWAVIQACREKYNDMTPAMMVFDDATLDALADYCAEGFNMFADDREPETPDDPPPPESNDPHLAFLESVYSSICQERKRRRVLPIIEAVMPHPPYQADDDVATPAAMRERRAATEPDWMRAKRLAATQR